MLECLLRETRPRVGHSDPHGAVQLACIKGDRLPDTGPEGIVEKLANDPANMPSIDPDDGNPTGTTNGDATCTIDIEGPRGFREQGSHIGWLPLDLDGCDGFGKGGNQSRKPGCGFLNLTGGSTQFQCLRGNVPADATGP